MNKIFLMAICLFVLTLTSCQFSENITIKEDGSGEMSFTFDGSQFMAMAGDKIGEDVEERLDSVMVFKEYFAEHKDSISKLSQEEQAKLKALENYRMHMLMDPATKEMKFDLISDFTSVSELQNMFDAMNDASNFNGKGAAPTNDPNNPLSAFAQGGTTEMAYTFENNMFKRTATLVDEKAYEKMVDSLGQLSAMFETSMYKLNYHFPRPIKSVSNEKVMFSADRKTMTLEVGFMDYFTDPSLLNLEVVLEEE